MKLVFALFVFSLGCEKSIRFATFDASMVRDKQGQLLLDLSRTDDPQIERIAEIIQRANPDVLLINGFDYDHLDRASFLFEHNYLSVPQDGADPIKFAYHFTGPVNAGVDSGFDLDHDGKAVIAPGTPQYANDAIGYGLFPGQYGMVLLSKYPIDRPNIRTFTRFKWKDMPGAMLPTDAAGKPWYSDEILQVLRLSSRSHWDVPIQIGDQTIHVLASHPVSTAVDTPEHRNAKRNHDEIRMWADYIKGGPSSKYLVDDTNRAGRDDSDFHFVLMGDLHADPLDGGALPGTVDQLLKNPRINSTYTPASPGAIEAAQNDGGNNTKHQTPAKFDTADFPDAGNAPGNLRVDYVLPSKDAKITGGGVFWPLSSDSQHRLVEVQPTIASSDHRLVYMDLKFSK
jgi:3-phytase